MKISTLACGFVAAAAATLTAGTASAQMMPTGAEISGHPVRVEFADGTVNTVYFNPDRTVRIVSDSGQTVAGNWAVQNQMICLSTGPSARECWPYRSMFQTGQPVVLTSDCQVTSRWTAVSTTPMAPMPEVQRSGERG